MSQSINSASQIRIILLLIAAYAVCTAVGVDRQPARGSAQRPMPGPVFEKALVRTTNEINKNLPFMVDAETRLDRTGPGQGKVLIYSYTLIHLAKGKGPDPSSITKAIRPVIINRYKSDKGLKELRDLGVVMRHRYFDRDGIFLTEFQVGPSDLR